jgi:transaldolase
MIRITAQSDTARQIREFLLGEFTPRYGELRGNFGTDEKWRRLRELGTELWLDTGDPEDVAALWTSEFSALTTNNTLLNKEVQKGGYDEFIPAAARLLKALAGFDESELRLELAFILNARHALALVERFDAHVSVEEHTDLADDMDAAVEYARRYHAICPERFYIKLPLTPAGVLATRLLSSEGIPVNHTLGFSARQNLLVARIAHPRFVNVFLGRLNSFIDDNGLGSGDYVGEKAVLASQRVIRELRRRYGLQTRQIGASLRNGAQVRDLAGLDIVTMPRKAAEPFLGMDMDPAAIVDRVQHEYEPGLAEEVDQDRIGLSTLWDVPVEFRNAVDELAREKLDAFTPDDLRAFMAGRGFGDLFPDWSEEEIRTSAEEGKIPRLENWSERLACGRSGLDALMNLAAINSFATDQRAMDERVSSLLAKTELR